MHSDKWDLLGSVFAALCCLGLAPVLGALSAVGLGFLIHDAILILLLALSLSLSLSLSVSVWGVRRDRTRHRHAGPYLLSALATVTTLAGLWISAAIVGAGLVALVAASLWNFRLVHGSTQSANPFHDSAR